MTEQNKPVAWMSSRNGFICKDDKNPEHNIPLFQHDQSARTQQLEAALKEAVEMIVKLVKVSPNSLGQCSGFKCRELYCISCNEEESAEIYLQSVYDLCGEANEMVSHINEVLGGE